MSVMTKKQLEAKVAELEAQLAKAAPAKKEPGFKFVPHNADYELWKAERILPDGSVIHWFIKNSKQGLWIDFQCNLRFGGGRAIPGIGGTRERWNVYDKYFMGQGYIDDRHKVIAECAKLAKKN